MAPHTEAAKKSIKNSRTHLLEVLLVITLRLEGPLPQNPANRLQVKSLLFEQSFAQISDQILLLLNNRHGLDSTLLNNGVNPLIDLKIRHFAVKLFSVVVLLEGGVADLGVHSELGDHPMRQLVGLLEVVVGPCGYSAEEVFFGAAAPQDHADAVQELLGGLEGALVGEILGEAQRAL